MRNNTNGTGLSQLLGLGIICFLLPAFTLADVTFTFNEWGDIDGNPTSFSTMRGEIVITNEAFDRGPFLETDIVWWSFRANGLGELNKSNSKLVTLIPGTGIGFGTFDGKTRLTASRLGFIRTTPKAVGEISSMILEFDSYDHFTTLNPDRSDRWNMNHIVEDLSVPPESSKRLKSVAEPTVWGEWSVTASDPCKGLDVFEKGILDHVTEGSLDENQINVVFYPGYGCSVSEAATKNGFSQLNWLSIITRHSAPETVDGVWDRNGNSFQVMFEDIPPRNFLIDPPKGGYNYQADDQHCGTGNFPTIPSADDYDWFWNTTDFCPKNNGSIDLGNDIEDHIFQDVYVHFGDAPGGIGAGQEVEFLTRLVGVYPDHNKGKVFHLPSTAFRWRAKCTNWFNDCRVPELETFFSPAGGLPDGTVVEFLGVVDNPGVAGTLAQYLNANSIEIEGAAFSRLDSRFGPDTLTIDLATDNRWLDLDLTVDRSYDEVAALMNPGGIFEGFRHATTHEVLELLRNAGFDDSIAGYLPFKYEAFFRLEPFVGANFVSNSRYFMGGFTGTLTGLPSDLRTGAVSVLGDDSPTSQTFKRGREIVYDPTFPTDFASADSGHWLIASETMPEANAGPDQVVDVAETTVFLDGTQSSGSQPLTYSWEIVNKPIQSAALLENASLAITSFIADIAGTYELALTVTDSDGFSSLADRMIVSVNAPSLGDVDGDGNIDRSDLNVILDTLNEPATSDLDPRDVDGDGMITVRDVRKAVFLCSLPRCATP